MKKLLILMFTLGFLVAFVTGCGEANIEKVENDTEENAVEAVSKSNSEDDKSEGNFAIGDTVNFDGLKVTVNSVKTSQGTNEWDKPDNDKYIVLDLALENTTEESTSISTMLQMNLMDAEGYTQDQSFMVDLKGSLDGQLGAGRTMKGEIAFDVNESEYYEFIFEEPFKSGQAIWQFEIEE